MDLLHFCRSETVPKVTELLLDAILFRPYVGTLRANKEDFFVLLLLQYDGKIRSVIFCQISSYKERSTFVRI